MTNANAEKRRKKTTPKTNPYTEVNNYKDLEDKSLALASNLSSPNTSLSGRVGEVSYIGDSRPVGQWTLSGHCVGGGPCVVSGLSRPTRPMDVGRRMAA